MQLGAFSISLPVQDLARSRAFYEGLGFTVTGGAEEQNYLILVNGTTIIGLFKGMFDKPMLTFNPGLGQDCQPTDSFTDVRDIHAAVTSNAATKDAPITDTANLDTDGPAHFVMEDPDGKPVMVDQFFPRPD